MSFSANFSLAEFQRASDRPANEREKEKAAQLSMIGDVIRHALGDRALLITSWLRNDDATSAHFSGDGVDGLPEARRFLSQRTIYDRVTAALFASGIWWGEVIFYPFSDLHIHWTLYPVGGTRQVLIADREEKNYRQPTPELLATLPTTIAPATGGGTALAIVAATLGAVAWAARGTA